jgi:hypothetical protein
MKADKKLVRNLLVSPAVAGRELPLHKPVLDQFLRLLSGTLFTLVFYSLFLLFLHLGRDDSNYVSPRCWHLFHSWVL